MNKNLIAIDPSFPQDSRAWPTQIKLIHISPLQTKYLTNTLSTTVLEAKGVIEISSKVLKVQTNREPEKLHQSKYFNRDNKVPKSYFGSDGLQISSSPKAEGACNSVEIN